MRAIAHEAKDVPCADCGWSYPYYVMTFDHVRGKKEHAISRMIQHPVKGAEQALREEIAKCDVVCMNCHALRHAGKCAPEHGA
jgi:hypothetical protein